MPVQSSYITRILRMMRHPTLLGLLITALFVRGGFSDPCVVSSGDDLKMHGTCTSAKIILFSEKDSITLNIEGSAEDSNSKLILKIEGCDVKSTLAMLSGVSLLSFKEGEI